MTEEDALNRIAAAIEQQAYALGDIKKILGEIKSAIDTYMYMQKS